MRRRIGHALGWGSVWLAAALTPLLVGGAAAAERSDPLWQVYSEGPEAKRRVVEECQRHLDSIRAGVFSGRLAADWNAGPDLLYLLEHRTPAALVVERELERNVPDHYLAALVRVAQRLGHRRLTSKLPEILKRVTTDEARLEVIRVLGELRTKAALQALEDFLHSAGVSTPENLVWEAAHGLSLTGDEKYLPVLRAAGISIASAEGRARLAAARYRCGEQSAVPELLNALKNDDVGPDGRACVLQALGERPAEEALSEVAALAVQARDARVAEAAYRALLRGTGYGIPPAEELLREAAAQHPDETAEAEAAGAEAAPAKRWRDTPISEREETVQRMLQWWQDHRQAEAHTAPTETPARTPEGPLAPH